MRLQRIETLKSDEWVRTTQIVAFTLIELLVVIGIIGIMASLALAGIIGAQRQTKSAVCMNNLKQQGVILSDFVSEHSRYPLFFVYPGQSARFPENVGSWIGTLFLDRLKTEAPKGSRDDWKGLLRCPTGRKPLEFRPNQGYAHFGYNADGLVGPNKVGNLGLGGAGALGESENRPVRENEVIVPSAMAAIGDGVIGWGQTLQDGLSKIGRLSDAVATPESYSRVRKRHGGKLNLVFCDGHVESIKIQQLFESIDTEALALWNRDHLPHAERLK